MSSESTVSDIPWKKIPLKVNQETLRKLGIILESRRFFPANSINKDLKLGLKISEKTAVPSMIGKNKLVSVRPILL